MLDWLVGRRVRRSHSAQYVAAARAILTTRGVLDDQYAAPMLTIPMRATVQAFRLPVLRDRAMTPFFGAIAARVTFFDDAVKAAVEAGISQVVTLGAGYDSRAWRFARPGVQFYEVDHPTTQTDKQSRAPAGGPTYVPLDMKAGSVLGALTQAKIHRSDPILFVIEGVTMYFRKHGVTGLLRELAHSAPGSWLAVNFAAPPATLSTADRRAHRVVRTIGCTGGEPHLFWLRASEAGSFVGESGWRVRRAVSLRDYAEERLDTRPLGLAQINPEASAVLAELG